MIDTKIVDKLKERGLTKRSLAEYLGIGESVINRTIRNPRITMQTLAKIAKFLDCPVSDLLSAEMINSEGNIIQNIKDIKDNHGYIGHTSISGDHNSHIGNINGSVVSGANVHNENRQPVSDISEIMEIQRNYQEIIKKSQEQMSRLIAIIEKNNDK